jgi:riboflavin transporter FmnP
MNSKQLAFISMMGALGNVLAFVTIAPTMVKQIALDFSNLPVLIAGTFAGPLAGFLTGIIAGILPSVFFGYIGGQLGILGFTASLGKALSGLTVGFLAKRVNYEKRTLILVPLVLIAFIPEAIVIIALFALLVPLFIPSLAFLSGLLLPILVKALFEMVVMGFFMSALAGHEGFKSFVLPYISPISTVKAKEA